MQQVQDDDVARYEGTGEDRVGEVIRRLLQRVHGLFLQVHTALFVTVGALEHPGNG